MLNDKWRKIAKILNVFSNILGFQSHIQKPEVVKQHDDVFKHPVEKCVFWVKR